MSLIRTKYPKRPAPSCRCRVHSFREQAHITAHLAYVEFRMVWRTRPDQVARHRVLSRLREYRRQGRYPVNDYHAGYSPVFVDRSGTHCAMAYLLFADDPDLVEHLATTDRFIRLEDPPPTELADWLAAHDITQAEAAMIQPNYPVCPPGTPSDGYCVVEHTAPSIWASGFWVVVAVGLVAAATALWIIGSHFARRRANDVEDNGDEDNGDGH